MSEAAAYGLLISFTGVPFGDSTEHAFVHGAEFGQLWQRMRSGREAEIKGTFHAVNRMAIERAAAADGWSCEFSEVSYETTTFDDWVNVTLRKIAAAKPNPHGLRVV